MRKRTRTGSIVVAAAAFTLVTAGCNPFSGPLPGDPTPSPYFIQHLEGTGTFPLEIDLGAASKNVYLTFVNPNLSSASGNVTVDGSAANREPASDRSAAGIVSSLPVTKRAPTPEAITRFNQTPVRSRRRSAPSLRLLERLPVRPLFQDVPNVTDGQFYDYDGNAIEATCRAVIGPVDIGGGFMRTLNIWVENDCWAVNAANPKPTYVTSDMVTWLADKFLKSGSFNDIYDWVAGMLGTEWGAHPTYPELIDSDGEITIFLCDIDSDESPSGGVVGYFDSRNNVQAIYEPYSNERVMFTIDAVMYANPTNTLGYPDPPGWNITDYWPEEIYSTLAHEFQHMIHFYQRSILRDASSVGDTWINEMASQVVEDLLSDKMAVPGPRGVDGLDGTDGTATSTTNTQGRLPLFNDWNDVSLSTWFYSPISEALKCYSITYAFGAWLARNYGGAALLNRLMKCTLTGPASIEDIVSQATGSVESFSRLLQRWSVAQLLSNETDAPPGYRYNTGTFEESTVNGNTYRLGSINLYNYSPRPYLYSRSSVGGYRPLSTSQSLCEAAAPGTGVLDWTLNLPDGVIATVVARP
jgi:hypothetical protein